MIFTLQAMLLLSMTVFFIIAGAKWGIDLYRLLEKHDSLKKEHAKKHNERI